MEVRLLREKNNVYIFLCIRIYKIVLNLLNIQLLI